MSGGTTTECETHRIACISNFHVSPRVINLLSIAARYDDRTGSENLTAYLNHSVWSGPYGAVVAAPLNDDELNNYLLREQGREYERQLWNVMHWALANGYKYVMFDRDAGVVPALPAYRAAWES